MKINYKKFTETAQEPSRAHEHDAGLDMYVDQISTPGPDLVAYHTGVGIEIPEGYVGILVPRSSVYRKDLVLTNHCGIVDSQFQGELRFIYRKTNPHTDKLYKVGDRCGQLVLIKHEKAVLNEVEEFGEVTDRGEGGFGSSGE